MSVKMEDWPKEKQVLLRNIKEKEERLKDFEKVRGKKKTVSDSKTHNKLMCKRTFGNLWREKI